MLEHQKLKKRIRKPMNIISDLIIGWRLEDTIEVDI